jgi:hypothetical protein
MFKSQDEINFVSILKSIQISTILLIPISSFTDWLLFQC